MRPQDSTAPRAEDREQALGVRTDASAGARKLRHAALVAGLLIVAGALGGLLPRWHHQSVLRAATRDLAIQTVRVASPVCASPSTALVLPAEVRPFVEAPVYARATGYLKRWLVDIGSKVKEGDVLAEIETPELDQELGQARAQLTQAQAALALAKTTAARWAELLKTQSVSEQETAEKQAELDLKAANVEAARANQARLEELQRFQKVRAPFDGVITARNIDIGQLIMAGSARELFHMAQVRSLRVFVRVPQTALSGIVPGQLAELSIPELAGKTFPGRIVRTSKALNAESRTLLTELEVDNPDGEILAGSFAQVRFTEAKMQSGLTLPSNALLFGAEGPQVAVVGDQSKIELRRVTLGRDFGPTVEIVGGVTSNELVILNPADSLVTGTTVRVASETDPEPKHN